MRSLKNLPRGNRKNMESNIKQLLDFYEPLKLAHLTLHVKYYVYEKGERCESVGEGKARKHPVCIN